MDIFVVKIFIVLHVVASLLVPEERVALEALYNSTEGNMWKEICREDWDFSEIHDPCVEEWHGISCSLSANDCLNTNCSIIQILLSECGMRGSLPQQLSYLTGLYAMDLSYNQVGGSLPNAFTAMASLFTLYLGRNEFTGRLPQLPSSLGSFFLSDNYISGTIPPYVSAAVNLFVIDARNNLIHGSIPPELVSLPMLVELSLENNAVTGSIPEFTLNSRKLQTLRMNQNCFTGTLPSTLSLLTRVITFEFGNNRLTGLLTEVASARRISHLDLSNNLFTSSLPTDFTLLSRLSSLSICQNLLTSSISPMFSMLSKLSELYIDDNLITGPFPEYIFGFPSFTTLNASNNYLSGPLTVPFLNQAFFGLYVDNNVFSGTVPEELNDFPFLRDVDLSYNDFSGSIPWGNDNPIRMQKFALSSNLLTGSLSQSLLTNASICQYFYVQDNFFTGSVPTFFGHDKALLQIFLADNFFSGTIPPTLSLPPSFQTLLLQGNILRGHPGKAFVNSSSSVVVIDLSNNRFEGSIPEEIFALPQLRWVSLIRNCFTGPITEKICGSPSLNVLLLDGLRSGYQCQHEAWSPFLSAAQAYITSAIPGGIPECLWSMPTLRMLHLSGNRITGRLPDNLNNNLRIRDLSLSHNRLTGTIPKIFQRVNYSYLDLSNNRFTGELFDENEWYRNAPMTNEVAKYTTKLYTNRLSGDVPKTFETMHRVNMLLGNIFACNNLPSADSNADTYVCESSALNNSLYIYIVLGGLWMIPAVLAVYLLRKNAAGISIPSFYTIIKNIQFWYFMSEREDTDSSTSTVPHKSYQLNMFLWMMRSMRQLAWMLGGFIVVVMLVCYSCMKSFASDVATHSHEYLWHFSGAYMSGQATGVMFIAALFILYLILIIMTRHITYSKHSMRIFHANLSNHESVDVTTSPLARVRSMQPSTLTPRASEVNRSKFSLFPSFARGSSGDTNTETSSIMNNLTSISNGKSVRSKAFVVSLVLTNAVIVILVKGCYVYYLLTASITPSTKYTLQFIVSLFDVMWNNVFISSAVRWFPSLVRSKIRIKINVFLLLFNTIIAPVVASVLTDGNCFLNLFEPEHDIKTYDTYVYCKGLSLTTNECISYGTLTLTTAYSPPFIYNYQCSSAVVSNFVPVFITTHALLGFVLPVFYIALMTTSSFSADQHMFQKVFAGILFPTIPSSKYVPRKFFHPGILTANLINHMVLLLTFGVMSPPLAFTICVTVSLNTLFWQTIVGRYMWIRSQQHVKRENRDGGTLGDIEYLLTLDKVCDGVWQGPLKSVWFVVDTSCVFFAFLLVDVVGDGSGWFYAITHFSVPMLCIPLLLRVVFRSNLSLHQMKDFIKWQKDISRESVCVSLNEIHALSNSGRDSDTAQRNIHSSGDFVRSVELSTSF